MADKIDLEILDNRIAAIRDNLRQLTEQAAGYSGAANEDLVAQRISSQEEMLAKLIAEREKLASG